MNNEPTKTIFRIFGDGSVIALFPEIPSSIDGCQCESYMTIGQHGAADYDFVIDRTDAATPQEYRSLLDELTKIGYNVKLASRCSPQMRRTRFDTAELLNRRDS